MSSLPVDPSAHMFPYFDDGNIVLGAVIPDATRSTRHYFRVHRSILCHTSAVFRDMFSLPQASADALGNEMYDSVPFVLMHDDARDLGGLLRLIYDPVNAFRLKRYDPRNLDVIEGPLKLATKYEMDALRARLIECISDDWPKTLAEWDALQDEKHAALSAFAKDNMSAIFPSMNAMGGPAPPHTCPEPDTLFPEPASAIRFAQRYNLPSILPAAFYTLHIIPARRDRDVGRSNLGTEGILGCFTARWGLLEAADLLTLMRGSDALADFISRNVTTHNGICYSEECVSACQDLFPALVRNGSAHALSPMKDVLGFLRAVFSDKFLEEEHPSICPRCVTLVCPLVQASRKKIWNELPKLFGLSDPDGSPPI